MNARSVHCNAYDLSFERPAGRTMNIATALSVSLRAPQRTLGALDVQSAVRLVEAAGDLVLILEPDGTIVDYALSGNELAIEGADHWVGRNWRDIVNDDSKPKVEDMLANVAAGKPQRWRQVNHVTSTSDAPVRYWALPSGNDGRVIAIGRDLRPNAALQQRLLQAQQALERDYLRLRQAESRYRTLFERAAEAIMVVDAETRRIREANPAAAKLLGAHEGSLVGRALTSVADPGVQEALTAYLGAVSAADQPPMALALPGGRGSVVLSATVFRQDQACRWRDA
jgi:transcriptional regulator PpsR